MTTTAKAAEIVRLLVEAGHPPHEALKIVREALEDAEKHKARKPVMKGDMK